MNALTDRTRLGLDAGVVLAKAVMAAAHRLGVTNRALGRILGTSEASVSRLGRNRAFRAESGEAEMAALFLRLFRSLDALTGGDEGKARAWYDANNRHLGGIPAERAQTVEGLVDVVRYLDAMRGKL